MDIDHIRAFCTSLPAVTEDIRWGNDLCFSIGGRMFCVVSLEMPLSVSFKVEPETFGAISRSPGLSPAPYVARYQWVIARDLRYLDRLELFDYIRHSYDLIKKKLPKRIIRRLGITTPENE
jgi:predicted DNA-binding protein (MmcQ/YjbR family)